ncbi:MAG: tRNA 2-thiocytidine(32) synthetase TtcA [Nanoarchaeota archaeon]|nr:tRNA 2-thiocytidine(32) synthetase TtcA [Nanoarchaeota archaeon]
MAYLGTKIRQLVGRGICEYDLIVTDDKILVAFSGGKDSFCMLDMLIALLKRSPVKFTLLAVMIDSGFGEKYDAAEKYLRNTEIPYLIKKTRIAGVVKEQIGEQKTSGTYCFMCSRLRRGILHKIAQENECTKIALGHNLDDVIVTYLLNEFYSSKSSTMLPKYYPGVGAKRGQIGIIRPLCLVPEGLIKEYALEKKFPIVKRSCILKIKDSKRESIKRLVSGFTKKDPSVYKSLTSVVKQNVSRKQS